MSKTSMSQSPVLRRRETVVSYLFLLPALFFFVCFVVTPMAMGVVTSLTDSHMGGSSFVGLRNYVELFQDPVFQKSMLNTVIIVVVSVPTVTVFSLWVGSAIYEMRAAARSFFRCVFYLPVVTGSVAVVVVWRWMFHTYNGLFNHLLAYFGMQGVDWYSEPGKWPFILTFFQIWKTIGYSTVMYISSLTGISNDYYEAAIIDGATKWQQIKSITLPCLRPMMIVLTILAIGRIFYADFGLFFQLPRDSGPLYQATQVIDTYVYRALKETGNVGMAAAASLYQSVVGFLLVMGANLVVRRMEPDSALF